MKPADPDPLEADVPGRATGLPLVLIGYWEYGPAADGLTAWRNRPGYQAQWPDVAEFVDERWDETERDRVAAYLDEGYVPWADAGWSECRFCAAWNGSAELTDGVYLWPEGLAHYVREHDVRLPVSVVRHILSRPARDERWRGIDPDGPEDQRALTQEYAPPALLLVGGRVLIRDRDEDWWPTLTEERVNYHWWKTATLNS